MAANQILSAQCTSVQMGPVELSISHYDDHRVPSPSRKKGVLTVHCSRS